MTPTWSIPTRWPSPSSTRFGPATRTCIGNVEARLQVARSCSYTSRFGIDLVNLREDQFQSRQVAGTYAAGAGGVAKSGYSAGQPLRDRQLPHPRRPTWAPDASSTPPAGAQRRAQPQRAQLHPRRRLQQRRLHPGEQRGGHHRGRRHQLARTTWCPSSPAANYTLDRKYGLGGERPHRRLQPVRPQQPVGLLPAASASWIAERGIVPQGRASSTTSSSARATGSPATRPSRDYPFQGLFGSANYGDTPGIAPTNLANPDLKWETTKQFDLGLDMAFAKGRVSLTADYYLKTTSDLLLDRPISGTSGFTSVFDNVGNVLNKGFELAPHHGQHRVAHDRRVPLDARPSTSAMNRNRVTALFNNQPFNGGERDINRVEVGQPIGAFYTLNFPGWIRPRATRSSRT